MICPFCLHAKTEVFNSRGGTRLNTVWRRRRCTSCSGQFTTYESADPGSLLVVKDKKSLIAFSHNRLQLTLLRCCEHRNDIDDSVPYLAADPRLLKHWRGQLRRFEGFRVGIVWQGNAAYVFDHLRSIPLAEYAPLAAGDFDLILKDKISQPERARIRATAPSGRAVTYVIFSETAETAGILAFPDP